MMNKEEVLKAIMDLPKVETNNPISAMNSISVDDLMSAVDRFDKAPTYDELLKENKDLQQRIDKINKYIEKCIGGVQELKHIRHLLNEGGKE